MFVFLSMLSPKIATFRFFDVKLLCKNLGQKVVSLREVGIVAEGFLVEYVVVTVVG